LIFKLSNDFLVSYQNVLLLYEEISMWYHYGSLFLLVFILLSFFYAVIGLCDVPYQIAKKRNHPQQDAIHVAGWVSLLTLHLIWPFLWIWATLYRPGTGWGLQPSIDSENKTAPSLEQQLSQLQNRFDKLEQTVAEATPGEPGKPETQNIEGGV